MGNGVKMCNNQGVPGEHVEDQRVLAHVGKRDWCSLVEKAPNGGGSHRGPPPDVG